MEIILLGLTKSLFLQHQPIIDVKTIQVDPKNLLNFPAEWEWVRYSLSAQDDVINYPESEPSPSQVDSITHCWFPEAIYLQPIMQKAKDSL